MTEGRSHITTTAPFEWACPACRGPLGADRGGGVRCPACKTTYACRDGIWRFLPDRRAAAFAAFLEQYEVVRRDEGWGRTDGGFYRALPDVPSDDPNRRIWQLRSASFRAFLRRLVVPLEKGATAPLRGIDLGAGNGWLAYRMARRGHRMMAVDVRIDAFDGLGAHEYFDAEFTSVRAEFDRLPIASRQFDLAVFNGSLHYSEDIEVTIREALRVLRPKGTLAILDSPICDSSEIGRRMVRQRERAFLSRFGFASNSIASEHFLTCERLREVADATAVTWKLFRPYFGVRWILRPAAAHLLGRRRPADFLVIAAEKPALRATRAHRTDGPLLPLSEFGGGPR